MNAMHTRRMLLLLCAAGLFIVLSSCHGIMGSTAKTIDRVVFSIAWEEPVQSAAPYSRSMSQIGESATLIAALYDGATLLEETVVSLSDGSTQASVSFSAIPVGLSMTLVATVNASSGLFLYEGSATFTVGQSGITQTSLTMQKSPVLVAVNTLGQAYISNDAITWLGPYPTGLTNAQSISYAKGHFIAVGNDGATNGVARSMLGSVWQKINLPISDVAYWVSSAPDGSVMIRGFKVPANSYYFHSVDGINWSTPTMLSSTGVGPVWCDGDWIITSSNATNTHRSSNGLTWTPVAPMPPFSNLYQINRIFGYGGKIVAGGGAPLNAAKQVNVWNNAITSVSGEINLPGTTHYINAFALDAARNRLLAVGSGVSAQAAYSDDYGSTWTVSTGTGVQTFRAAVKWKGGFIIGNAVGQMYRSSNGAVFSPAGAATGVEISGIAYNGAP